MKRSIALFSVLVIFISAFGILSVRAYDTPVHPDKWGGTKLITNHEYSFVFVGDTQSVTYHDYNNKTTYMSDIYKWIVDNKEKKKIAHVFGLGDITESNKADEWEIAKKAITQMDGIMPYTLVRGNHDGLWSMNFQNYFGDSQFAKDIDGCYNRLLANSYKKFDVGAEKYLFLQIDYFPSDLVLAWAGEIISANPDRKVIITTHGYLNYDGSTCSAEDNGASTAGQNYGDAMWDKLVSKHENILMIISGHVGTDGVVYSYQRGINGNKVLQLLVDPQGYDAGTQPTGRILIMNFTDGGKKVKLEYYSTILGRLQKYQNHVLCLSDLGNAEHKGEVDLSDTEKYGHVNTVLSNYIASAPTLDGKASTEEYTEIKVTPKSKAPEGKYESDLVEYFAQDEDYIYYAYSIKQSKTGEVQQFCFKPNGAKYDISTLRAQLYPRMKLHYSMNADGTLTKNNPTSVIPASGVFSNLSLPVWGTDVFLEATRDNGSLVNTFEFRISKDYFEMNDPSYKKLDCLAYLLYLGSDDESKGVWNYLVNDELLRDLKKQGYNESLPFVYNYIVFDDAIVTRQEASTRISTTKSGLRFKSEIKREKLDELIAVYGKENVSVGTLIAPLDSLDNGVLTHGIGENKIAYVDVVAYIDVPYEVNDDVLVYTGAIVNIHPHNLTRNFKAVGYIGITDENGKKIYIYSNDNSVANVDNIARLAYNDVDSVQTEKYCYEVSGGIFSPYDENQREIIRKLFSE